MYARRFALSLSALTGLFTLFSCGESGEDGGDECDRGSEGCRCKRDDSCDEGLACRSDVCVDLGTGGVAGSTGGKA
ncbi:MAG TPA: hypothetical protein VGK73_28535, partial [Polyangiaceae bacterium]